MSKFAKELLENDQISCNQDEKQYSRQLLAVEFISILQKAAHSEQNPNIVKKWNRFQMIYLSMITDVTRIIKKDFTDEMYQQFSDILNE